MKKPGLVRATMLNSGAALVYFFASLVGSMIAGHRLDPADFGTGQFTMWLAQIAWLVFGAGIPSTMSRYIALWNNAGQARETRALLRIGSRVAWIGTALATLAMLWFSRHQTPAVIGVSACLCIAVCLQGYWYAVVSGYYRYDAIFRATVPASILGLALVYPATIHFGLPGYLGIQAISLAVAAWALARAAARMNGEDGSNSMAKSAPVLAEIRPYALSTWAAAIVSAVVWQRGELFFVEHFLGARQVAYFCTALFIVDLVYRPWVLLIGALLPRFAGQVGAGERPALLADYRLATKLLAWGAFFPLAFLACNAGEFTVMVFGAQLSEAAPLVPMLSLGGAIGAVALVGSTVIYAEGKAAFIFRSGIAGALLVAVAGLSIVPAWGIYGAAFVRVLVQGLLVLAGAIYIRRLGYRFPIKAVLMCMLAAAAACIFPLLLPPLSTSISWRWRGGSCPVAQSMPASHCACRYSKLANEVGWRPPCARCAEQTLPLCKYETLESSRLWQRQVATIVICARFVAPGLLRRTGCSLPASW